VLLPDKSSFNNGILIRSNKQAINLHSHLPFAFPIQLNSVNKQLDEDLNESPSRSSKECKVISHAEIPFQQLVSCTTVFLLDGIDNSRDRFHTFNRRMEIREKVDKSNCDNNVVQGFPVVVQGLQELACLYSDRSQLSVRKGLLQRNVDDNEIDLSEDSVEKSLLVPANIEESAIQNEDDNEIDLSEGSESDSEDKIEFESSMPNASKINESSPNQPPCKKLKTDNNELCKHRSVDNHSFSKAMLLVLGTGCASPSALRGSSGYALLQPTMYRENNTGTWKNDVSLTAIIECGEGCLAMLNRYFPRKRSDEDISNSFNSYLTNVRVIWISHAHLDHYGELPLLIKEISKFYKKTDTCTCYELNSMKRRSGINTPQDDGKIHTRFPKCRRCSLTSPPLVVAPQKVLRFLDISLDCKNGITKEKSRIYFGISNRDFDSSPFAHELRDDLFGYELFNPMEQTKSTSNSLTSSRHLQKYNPFQYFRSVPVEHCPNAYGLILGLQTNPNDPIFHLCYSGDTRPSSNLIRACEQLNKQRCSMSLLLHEATFDDDEKGKNEAIKKRHSTVQEAVQVANKINASACLLTHFSQRYPKLPPGHDMNINYGTRLNGNPEERGKLQSRVSVGFACDGMLIPLDEFILPRLLPLLSDATIQVIINKNKIDDFA